MNKELFISTIDKLRALDRKQSEFSNMLHKIDSEFGGCLIHSKTIEMVEDLLKNLMNDEYDYIGYYMWELDFGDKYYEGVISEADGTPIPLSTAEDLYNLLMSDKS